VLGYSLYGKFLAENYDDVTIVIAAKRPTQLFVEFPIHVLLNEVCSLYIVAWFRPQPISYV